jgi:ketosteroid isomerase-like protein
MKHFFFPALAAVILNTLVTANVHSSEISDAIDAGNQEFEAAFGRSDAAGLAGLYSAEAQLLPPNHESVAGADAIQGFWQGAIDMGIKEAALETIELEEHGDTAIEVGRYTLKGGDGQVMDNGKYIVIWKNEDGHWKLHRDMWSSVSAGQ